MADWMELPNYPISTFRQQRHAYQSRSSTNTNEINSSLRATYDEIRLYYIQYVKRNRLTKYFHNYCEVKSLERVSIDKPFYDDINEEIRTPEIFWQIHVYDKQKEKSFFIHAKYVVLATGIPQNITRPLGIVGEQASQSFTYTNLYQIEELISQKCLSKTSKPLLIIGCGLTALDVLLLCQQYSIPVLHVFRRAIDDNELILNQLSSSTYPEYERMKDFIRYSSPTNEWSYQCFPQSEILSITEDGTVHIRHLQTRVTTDHDISFVARLTGTEMPIPFHLSCTRKKSNSLDINPYTYECIDFDDIYAIGALAGDKLVRFLQGGAFACAASLLKKSRQR